MGIYKSDIADIELQSGSIFRSFLCNTIGAGDTAGNRFAVRIKENGIPVSLSGASCVGYFIRSDGVTLVIDGDKDENIAYVDLPEAAYAIEGQFTLAIKVSGTGFADTMRIVDGTVVKTTTGTISDPASVVPSLAELNAVIANAEAAVEQIGELSIEASVISGTRYKIALALEVGE